MSELWAGGEIGAWTASSGAIVEITSAGTFDSNFARCSIKCINSSDYAESASWAQTSDFWFHTRDYLTGATLTTGVIFSFYDGSTEAFRLSMTSWSSNIATYQMYYYNGSGFSTIGSSFTAADDTLQTIDIHIVAGVSGSAAIYFSGVERASGSANLSNFTGITKVRAVGSALHCISECIAASESTIGRRLMTVVPTGNGANTAWAGDYTGVDEAVNQDGDIIASATANQVETYTCTPVGSLTGYAIQAVIGTARAKKGASGPTQLQFAWRISSTDYFSASKSLSTGYGAIYNVWETSPATSTDITAAEITAGQFGVKSIA